MHRGSCWLRDPGPHSYCRELLDITVPENVAVSCGSREETELLGGARQLGATGARGGGCAGKAWLYPFSR